MPSETDVIIIGAGSSGLSAAKELARLGLTYTVVEGAHRIGGRAYSEEIVPGVWFDLGCAWLVGGAINPFVAIADKMGITLDKNHSDMFIRENHKYYRNGDPLNADQRVACQHYYGDSYKAISDAAKQDRDIPLSDVVDLDNEFIAPFMDGIAAAWGLDLDQVSTTDVANAKGELGFQAPHGYGNLVATWGADVPVSLNTRVERIDWSGPGVVVETPKGTIRGRTVLSTVSTGILASGDILFTPKLPDWKSEAIDNLPMGTENKMGVHFNKDVFGADGCGHYTTWNADGESSRIDASVMGLNSAHVFSGGRHGIWLEKQGQQACRDFAVNRLAEVFGNDIRKHIDNIIVTAWSSEPWTRGSWACAKPGQAHQRANLERSIDERLFFAGEAASYSGQGTCDGAYQTGIRAAQEIAGQLNITP